jgi:hypothetical protein
MKRTSSSFRLQIIKEVALKQQKNQISDDPMANYIHHLLAEKPQTNKTKDLQHSFSGNHFDSKVGGWISDRWNMDS